jgi:hypothetical protein
MGRAHSIQDDVTAVLTEMGISTASLVHTILLREKFFVGHKFRFDGGHAIWWAENNSVGIYRDGGKLLKIVVIEADEKEAAQAANNSRGSCLLRSPFAGSTCEGFFVCGAGRRWKDGPREGEARLISRRASWMDCTHEEPVRKTRSSTSPSRLGTAKRTKRADCRTARAAHPLLSRWATPASSQQMIMAKVARNWNQRIPDTNQVLRPKNVLAAD